MTNFNYGEFAIIKTKDILCVLKSEIISLIIYLKKGFQIFLLLLVFKHLIKTKKVKIMAGKKVSKLKWFLAILFIIVLSAFVLTSGTQKKNFVKPKISNVIDSVYSYGTVESETRYNLVTSLTSQIRKLYVTEGDRVKKNAPLVLLDNGVLLKAPFKGVVTELYYHENETITPNQKILTLADLDNLSIKLSMDQETVLKIREKQKAEIIFDNLENKKLKGEVFKRYPSLTDFIVKVKLDEIPSEILPGMTCDTVIIIQDKKDSLLIPIAAIDQDVLTLIRDKKEIKIKPRLGIIVDDWVEIVDGSVKEDDQIPFDTMQRGKVDPKQKTFIDQKANLRKNFIRLILLVLLIIIPIVFWRHHVRRKRKEKCGI